MNQDKGFLPSNLREWIPVVIALVSVVSTFAVMNQRVSQNEKRIDIIVNEFNELERDFGNISGKQQAILAEIQGLRDLLERFLSRQI